MPARSPVLDRHNDLPWEMRVRPDGDPQRRDLAREGPTDSCRGFQATAGPAG